MHTASEERFVDAGAEIESKQSNIGLNISKLSSALFLIATFCGLYLLNGLVREFHSISTNLSKIDRMSSDVRDLSDKLTVLQETNKKLDRMEGYLKYIPAMAKASNGAVMQAEDSNRKMDAMLTSFSQTRDILNSSTAQVSEGLSSIGGIRNSMDQMTAQLPALKDMHAVMNRADERINQAALLMPQVLGTMDKVNTGFDSMQATLQSMNTQMSALPEMQKCITRSNDSLAATASTLDKLGETLPALNTSLAEMTKTSQEMNRTTQEMSKSLKKTPKQGALGVAILTAVGLAK